MITMDNIMQLSVQLTNEYIELMNEQLKPYNDEIDALGEKAKNAATFEERKSCIDKMMALCKEMEETKREMIDNPEYMIKFFVAKMRG